MTNDPRVQEVVEQVLESQAAPEDLCVGDSTLLRAVRKRLKQFHALKDRLDNLFPPGTTSVEGRSSPHSTGSAYDFFSGQQLGDYRIVREIGRGGMGVVYEAIQVSLGRRVALKVLSRHGPIDSVQLERFQREARSTALLHHTSIVTVFDVGVCGGTHYYAMQFIRGQGLNRVLADWASERSQNRPRVSGNTTSAGQAHYRNLARIGALTAEALAFAHTQHILHRDIKPANILLAADGGVWICDFGLAKTEAENLTHTGDVVGTIRYMAPERLSGVTDARSDIYSLGLTLYEMLTLKPAFDESDRGRLIRQIAECEPAPPTQLDRRVPADLETIVLKAIAKEPRSRYQSAIELAEDLKRFLADQPILARPANIWERSWKWAKRRPGSAMAIGVSILALIGTATMATGFTLRLKTERDLADRQRERAEASYELARDAMDQGFKSVRDDPRLQKGNLEDLKRKMIQIETEFLERFVQLEGDDATFQSRRSDAYYRLGHAAINFGGTHDVAIANFRRAIELDRELMARDLESVRHKKHLADGLYSLGCQLRYTCHLDAAISAHREAEEIANQLRASEPNNAAYQALLAEILDDRALCEILLGEFTTAEATVLRAEPIWAALAERVPQNKKYRWLQTIHWLRSAATYSGPNSLPRKEGDFYKALSLAERLSTEDPGNPEYQLSAARALIELGGLNRGQNRLEHSLDLLKRANAICERLVNDHPTTSHFLHDLAYCRRMMGATYAALQDFESTVQWYKASIELYERLDQQHPDVLGISSELGAANSRLGAALNQFGKPETAIPYLDRAVVLLEHAVKIDTRSRRHIVRVVEARWERGFARLSLFQYAKARPDYDRAIELGQGQYPRKLNWQRADIVAHLGDHRAAFAEIEATSTGKELDGNQCIYLARIARACSRAVSHDNSLLQTEIDALAERYDARAVAWMARAKAAGYFVDLARVRDLQADPEFAPLRARDDFRKLFP